MKTAISLPDEIFQRAERAAKDLGVTRSELYARAVDQFVHSMEGSTLTKRLDAAIERSGQDPETTTVAVSAGRQLLRADREEW